MYCEELEKYMIECHVDEERNRVLTKISKTKQGTRRVESDHNSIITRSDLSVTEKQKVRNIEIFNFKDENGLKKFKEMTSKTSALSSIFESKRSVEKQAKYFLNRPNGILHQCLKKIKITSGS